MRAGCRGHTQIRSLNWVLSHRRSLQVILYHFRGLSYFLKHRSFLKFSVQVRLQFAFRQGHFQEAFPLMTMDWVYSSVPIPRDPPSLFDVLDQVVFFSTSLVSCGSEDVCSLTFGSVLGVAWRMPTCPRCKFSKSRDVFKENRLSIPFLLLWSAHPSLVILVKSIWADSDLILYVTC